MKNWKKILLIGVPSAVAVFVSFSFFPKFDQQKKESIIKEIIFKSLHGYHFKRLDLNSEFSGNAYDQFLKSIDPSKRFFLKSDVKKFNAFKKEIHQDLTGEKQVELFDLVNSTYEQRLSDAKVIAEQVLAKPFNFSKKESVTIKAENIDYASSEKDLKDRWRKLLKYQALVRYHGRLENQKKKFEDGEIEKDSLKSEEKIEQEVRESLQKSTANNFSVLEKIDRDDYFAKYVNAALSVYDPHTEFFPPQEKDVFDIQMSGQLEGIGAQLLQDQGNVKVVRIVPGSASWKQGELKAEDLILKVAQADGEPVPITDMPLKDAVSLIKGKKGTEVRLTVKKPDGRIVEIPIIRDIVILEESYAKSTVIHDSINNQKVGYILLPSFYADFNKENGRSCAKDVAKEVKKLKSNDVDAIIIDIRSNGGGSLGDVVEMAGLFIEKGPIVQVKGFEGEVRVLEDTDPSVLYDGPLAVMVSKTSASASEILASALQDYERAIIVGGKSTWGKGSVQRFIELDKALPPVGYNEFKPLGALKLTIQQFYRINGDAIQERGVIPDVQLPELYSELEIGEKFSDFHLTWNQIPTAQYQVTGHYKDDKIAVLQASSKSRIDASPVFSLIKENAVHLKDQQEKDSHTLRIQDYKKEQEALEEKTKAFDDLKPLDGLGFTSLRVADEDVAIDSLKQEDEKRWLDNLKKDYYLVETLSLLAEDK